MSLAAELLSLAAQPRHWVIENNFSPSRQRISPRLPNSAFKKRKSFAA